MRYVVPVSVRAYPQSEASDALCIAETLDAPFVAVAATSADEAIAEIHEVVREALEHAHPRMIGYAASRGVPQVHRTMVPLYRAASYEWNAAANGWQISEAPCLAPVDVLRRSLEGGLVELSIPLYGVWTVFDPRVPVPAAAGEQEPRDPEAVALADLTSALSPSGRSLGLHRPAPTETTVVTLEVEFTPLDLTRVPVDAIWSAEFDAADLAGGDGDHAPATPTLDEVAQCWTSVSLAEGRRRGFAEAYGRDATIVELGELLAAEQAAAVVLVGPPRVGKTAIIKHLTWAKITADTPGERRIWFADAPRMTSTDAYTVEWRQQCASIVAELEETDDILYFGRLVEALDAGKYFGSDYNLAQFLKPVLADRRIRLVAEATVEEWNEIERRDVGFARTFTVMRIDDPQEELARSVVKRAVARLGEAEGVAVADDAVERAWALQRRFSIDGSTVGRSIDFVRRAVRVAANAFRKTLSQQELVEEFCRYTGLPPILLLDDRRLDIDRVRQTIGSRVLGQEDAVRSVSDVIGITKAGLSSPDKPLGSFLFVGPTGVGKTELAKALAEYLFGDDERLVRLDMSEYSHGDAYARLIGEGREDGDLTGPIRRQPFSVILLDEIEKAHPSVFDLLLQVLGEARLTDVNGRTTGFRNTIVIMTSNLGVESLRPAIGFGEESVADSWMRHFRREAERFFRPEFLARIDQFIAFGPLTEEVVRRIAEREVARLRERDGLRSQDVELVVDPGVYGWLAARGWDQRYGARPLKRVIEQELAGELARRLAAIADKDQGATRVVTVSAPEGDPRRTDLRWEVSLTSQRHTDASARRTLLAQLEAIADLRRRLQRYMGTVVFQDLEWRIENFDLSSQSKQFWEDPNASDFATEAEHARRVVEPAHTTAAELAAMEDLANEGYHGRTFDLTADIDERLAVLRERVSAVIIAILRAAYEEPDNAVLFLHCRPADEAWRRQLIAWYRRRAVAKSWEIKMWQPRPDKELKEIAIDEYDPYDDQRLTWVPTEEPTADVVALELRGYAVRPLVRPEDGLHRLISADGNAVVDVWDLEEYADWPWASRLQSSAQRTYVALTYNFRTLELTVSGYAPVKLDVEDPLARIDAQLEEIAWRITDNEWE